MSDPFPRPTDPETPADEDPKAGKKEDKSTGGHTKKTTGWEVGLFVRRIEEETVTPPAGGGTPDYDK